MNNNIRKKFGSPTIGAGSSPTLKTNVYQICPNNPLTPSSIYGIKYKDNATFPTTCSVNLDTPSALLDVTLPDGIGVAVNVSTGDAILIANTSPAPSFDLIQNAYCQVYENQTKTVTGSGSQTGKTWTLSIPVNIF